MDMNWSKSKVEIENEEGSISPFLAEKVTEHPKYKNEEWSEERVFKEFSKSFEQDPSTRDGKVSCVY